MCASGAPITSSAAPLRARPTAPIILPLASSPSQRLRWGSEPECSIKVAASTLPKNGAGATDRPSSSHRIDSSTRPRPWPPYCSETAIPGHPSSHSSRHSSWSMWPASACSRTRSGFARSARSSRAVRCISRWSSVRPKSILSPYAVAFSRGRPSTRSATMFFSTSVVPPSRVLPLARSSS